ncbi:hypothetical protein AVEN_73281-1 [Araneus ventricosus]|uniref:Uncharacterized protein n=1 Tax=Araneus ventricosus TaxID=182803 RepID=A0A4Y2VE89_ARAVE|nr:hypothetical protein AVEN_73281-1 [Araneus ventricosus]
MKLQPRDPTPGLGLSPGNEITGPTVGLSSESLISLMGNQFCHSLLLKTGPQPAFPGAAHIHFSQCPEIQINEYNKPFILELCLT